MRSREYALVVLVAALAWASPALAQYGEEQVREVTYRLVVYGEAPTSDGFSLAGSADYSDDITAFSYFCGAGGDDGDEYVPCLGGGTAYTGNERSRFYDGERATVRFYRVEVDSQGRSVESQVFAEPAPVVTDDLTIIAYYDYRTGRGGAGVGPGNQGGDVQNNQQQSDSGSDDQQGAGDGQQEIPEDLPQTGAGGLAGSGALWAMGVVAAAAFLFSGYAACRRRKSER